MAGQRKGADRYMKKEMLQQVMTAPKKIEFRSVPVPEIGEDQVLVKIMKIGIVEVIFMCITVPTHLLPIR